MKKKNNIKLAVLGAGYWGKNLVRIFSRLGVLDTVCDADPGVLKRIKKDYPHLNLTSSYADILRNKTIKAVVISTPAATHYSLAKKALIAGKDIFIEKPLALNVREGREIVELAIKKNRILMVGHLLEYHPAINKLKQLVEEGRCRGRCASGADGEAGARGA